jgi:DNA uptake protein ComE-like DNA-binding protein
LAFALASWIVWAPAATSAAAAPGTSAAVAAKKAQPALNPAPPIDINSASREQLKTLPGIGDVEADRIVSARPYHSKADLAERDVIPTGVYVSLKGRIIAKQKSKGKVGVP